MNQVCRRGKLQRNIDIFHDPNGGWNKGQPHPKDSA